MFERIASLLWTIEADDRLAAYKRGELPAVTEDEVFRSYRKTR